MQQIKQSTLDFMRRLFGRTQKSYVMSIGSPAGKDALADLARFCYACEPVWHSDPNVRIALEGRREVWLHIQKNLQLSEQQVWELYIQGLNAAQE